MAFIDGAATPPNLGGEFSVTFRVYERSHNAVPKLETSCGYHCSQIRKNGQSPAALIERRYSCLEVDNASPQGDSNRLGSITGLEFRKNVSHVHLDGVFRD